MKDQKVFLFGYHPLFYMPKGYTPGSAFTASPDQLRVSQFLSNIPEIHFPGVVWAINDDVVSPVIICDRAKEVADHFKYYTCSAPEQWFKFFYSSTTHKGKRGYAIVLHPDLDMCVRRFRHANEYYSDVKVESDKYTIVYNPISVFAPVSPLYLKFAASKPKSVKVSLFDSSEVRAILGPENDLSKPGSIMNGLENLQDVKEHELGTFEVAKPSWMSVGKNAKYNIQRMIENEL